MGLLFFDQIIYKRSCIDKIYTFRLHRVKYITNRLFYISQDKAK